MNPLLLGMPGQSYGALSGTPATGALGGGQSLMQSLQNSNLGGFGMAGALGAILPAMIMSGGMNQGGGGTQSSLIGQLAQIPSSQSSQSDGSQWQALIQMLMQKMGLSAAGGSGSLSGLGSQGGFLSGVNSSGIYGR